MVRVLHIVGRMDRAGAEIMIMNIYRWIDRERFQFDFVYFTNDHCDLDGEIEVLGGRIIRLKGDNPVQRFWRLFRVLQSGKWSIVQSHMLFSTGLHLLAARLAGIPVRIAHSHNTSDSNSSSVIGRMYQRTMRWLLAWVPTHYVACGTAAAEYLYPGRLNVEIIPNAIDVNYFSQANRHNIHCETTISGNCITVLQVGRLMPVKNQAWTLKIASAMRDAGVYFQVLLVGEGPDRTALESQIAELGLADSVNLLGLREDIAELMALADVMLMPSLHEGFPVVLVESQAAGLPSVISSAISPEVDLGLGMVEFVELGKSAEYWAERIIASDRLPYVPINRRREKLEQAGFSAKASAERIMSLYELL